MIQKINYQTEVQIKLTVLENQITQMDFMKAKADHADLIKVLDGEIERVQNLIEIYRSVLE